MFCQNARSLTFLSSTGTIEVSLPSFVVKTLLFVFPVERTRPVKRPRWIRIIVLPIIALLIGVSVQGAKPQPARATITTKLIVPAYFYPDVWNTPNNWYTMCDNMPTQSIAIMNPNSGPGTAQNSDYTSAVDRCQNDSQNVIGYVHTSYGSRSETDVKAEIDDYYSWYGVDGIFLDEMSSSSSTQSYYSDLYSYIHTKGGSLHDLVVGNMGVFSSTDWPLNNGDVVDLLVGFEGSHSDYANISPPSWINNYLSGDFAALVYNTSSSDLSSTCSSLSSVGPGIEYRYITDDTLSNPWDTLPSYWSTEASSC
jgi:hypothetical protein